ncbi:MAG: MoaD/ThiS family protein [Proteobacteria bacterium]|nr:MoaD/ThiS family protein [Pseudomonadota bacterium]
MGVNVRIPTPLRKFTGGKEQVEVNGSTISEVVDDLEKSCPGMKEKLYDDNGSIRKFLNIYLNDEDIRFMESLDTQVKDGDTVSLIPAIAGGLSL